MSARNPTALDALIDAHKASFGDDPVLIMMRDSYRMINAAYYNRKIYALCCGKGFLYRGIPMILTNLPYVEDFAICY